MQWIARSWCFSFLQTTRYNGRRDKEGAWSAGRLSRIAFSAIFHTNIFPMGGGEGGEKELQSFLNSRSEQLNVSYFYFEERKEEEEEKKEPLKSWARRDDLDEGHRLKGGPWLFLHTVRAAAPNTALVQGQKSSQTARQKHLTFSSQTTTLGRKSFGFETN